jgi:spore coat protein U domain-containing protein, fimbrial subunit CupE1/2/3/6
MHRLTIRISMFAAALGLALVATPAAAGSATAELTISATVVKNCTIDAQSISLGTYDPLVANYSNAAAPTGTITVQCTKNTAYSIALTNGGNYSAGFRRMKHAINDEYLQYELFQDGAFATAWTDTQMVSKTATSRAPLGITVYARIPGGQDVSQGTYTDVVTATVNF